MFDLLDLPLAFVPIKWPGIKQAEDGTAEPIEHAIEIQVQLLDRDEINQWVRDGAQTIADPVERTAHELATFKRVAKGWRKVKMNGRSPDFSDENVARLLRFPGFVDAFGEQYIEAWHGRIATREGNSEGSPANGLAGEPTAATSKAATPPAN